MRPAAGVAGLGLGLGLCAGAFDAEPLWAPGLGLLVLALVVSVWVERAARGATIDRTLGARRVEEDEALDVVLRARVGGGRVLPEPAPPTPRRSWPACATACATGTSPMPRTSPSTAGRCRRSSSPTTAATASSSRERWRSCCGWWDPGARGHGIHAGHPRRDERGLERAGRQRALVGRGVVPALGMGDVRSHPALGARAVRSGPRRAPWAGRRDAATCP